MRTNQNAAPSGPAPVIEWLDARRLFSGAAEVPPPEAPPDRGHAAAATAPVEAGGQSTTAKDAGQQGPTPEPQILIARWSANPDLETGWIIAIADPADNDGSQGDDVDAAGSTDDSAGDDEAGDDGSDDESWDVVDSSDDGSDDEDLSDEDWSDEDWSDEEDGSDVDGTSDDGTEDGSLDDGGADNESSADGAAEGDDTGDGTGTDAGTPGSESAWVIRTMQAWICRDAPVTEIQPVSDSPPTGDAPSTSHSVLYSSAGFATDRSVFGGVKIGAGVDGEEAPAVEADRSTEDARAATPATQERVAARPFDPPPAGSSYPSAAAFLVSTKDVL